MVMQIFFLHAVVSIYCCECQIIRPSGRTDLKDAKFQSAIMYPTLYTVLIYFGSAGSSSSFSLSHRICTVSVDGSTSEKAPQTEEKSGGATAKDFLLHLFPSPADPFSQIRIFFNFLRREIALITLVIPSAAAT